MPKGSQTRTFLRQHGPMAAFGGLTLIGIAFIWTAKLWGLGTAFVTAVPIGIMIFYLVISLIAASLRVHNEQAGDNLYYMGFLFTLTSLGVSLYRFAGDVSIDEIVRNFGIAVTSTICGIALRILFNQMRRDPVEIERSVRHELAEMTRRVRTELDSSAREFSSYRRTSSQMLLEGFEEIATQAEKTGEAIQKAIEALSKESIKPIQETAAKLAVISDENLKLFEQRAVKANELAEQATERLNSTSEKITTLVEGLSSSIEHLSIKMNAMRLPDEVIRMELKPTLDAVSQVADLQKRQSEDAVRQAEEATKRVDRQTAAFLESVRPVTGIPEQIAQSLQPVRDLSKTLQESVSSLVAVPRQIAALVNSLNEVSGALRAAPEVQSIEEKTSAYSGKTANDETLTLSGANVADVKPAKQEGKAAEDGKPKKGWFRRW
ncbi:hypothetical protein [Pannonibacter phragmitetus]|uniref:Transmembrane protein n=1 Tax=Pannonibacter phragmitetus TaxID=121719 RepID=A0A0U3PN47_9HYPH|nr:hypothetical protein [Pannonibacter phragmitetus]ALV28924.1 hypothetical protein APZ00_19295 [Pannonibacter phragmitetus]